MNLQEHIMVYICCGPSNHPNGEIPSGKQPWLENRLDSLMIVPPKPPLSVIFHIFPMILPCFSHMFPMFFHIFPMILPWFFPYFPIMFPDILPCFSH